MLKRNLLLKLSSLMLAGSMLAGAPAIIPVAQAAAGGTTASHTAAVNSWTPAKPMRGMASIVFINYNGNGLPINLDFAGKTYVVPVATNNGPGRLQINVAPGSYNYTASVPDPFFNALSRTVDVSAGQVAGLGFYQTIPGLIDQHHASSSADARHNRDSAKVEYFVRDKNDQLAVAQSDLTVQVR